MSKGTEFLRIGKITGAHGLNGRLKIEVISDFMERFEAGNQLYLYDGLEYRQYRIIEFIQRPSKSSLLKISSISDRDTALSYMGRELFIDKRIAEKTRKNLGPDDYYYYDIIGCLVYWKGDYFGKVVDIMKAGEGDVLLIKDSTNKEFFIPFIESMVDVNKIFDRRIDINPIDGLLDI